MAAGRHGEETTSHEQEDRTAQHTSGRTDVPDESMESHTTSVEVDRAQLPQRHSLRRIKTRKVRRPVSVVTSLGANTRSLVHYCITHSHMCALDYNMYERCCTTPGY